MTKYVPSRLVRWAGYLAVAFVIPYVFVAPSSRLLVSTALIYALLAAGWNLTLGFGGIFNFAHAGMFGIGGYAMAIATLRWQWDSLPALAFAVLVGAIVGGLTYLPVIRMRGIYIALITFVFVQISYHLVLALPDLTGGSNGLPGVPAITIAGQNLARFGGLGYLWLLGAAVAAMLIVLELIMASPFGHSLVALRDNEQLARSRGINRIRQQFIAFVISGAMAGLTGALYVAYFRVADVGLFGFGLVTLGLSMIFLGGTRQIWGPVLGAVVVTLADHRLTGLDAWRPVVFAAGTIAVLIFAPGGISAALTRGASVLHERLTNSGRRETGGPSQNPDRSVEHV
ncbi:branched-chain amino acid ABC transporter permease [Streptosporangium sp. NPDC020072]|uniref:branched-chain amino acid ABC transporter permease n=1 Tax=Streptosporangium sp. NPDC020072 TaxID=3154788 RepID=UPI0034473D9D